MRQARGGFLPLLLGLACAWGGGSSGAPERVDDPRVLSLAARIDAFYGQLEGEPLDALATFEDANLRACFPDDQDFSDYFAGMARRVRLKHFRHATAESIVIREFRVDGNVASVDLTLTGPHERSLIFWDQVLEQRDVWRFRGGAWFLVPGKL